MKIALGSDHAGLPLKKEVIAHLSRKGITYEDLGSFDPEPVDYPDYAWKVATKVAGREYDFGILVCGTGIGISIAANKVRGIRAANCTNCYMARMAREHNDANILALGSRVLGSGTAIEIVESFLHASYIGGSHAVRVDKIREIEDSAMNGVRYGIRDETAGDK